MARELGEGRGCRSNEMYQVEIGYVCVYGFRVDAIKSRGQRVVSFVQTLSKGWRRELTCSNRKRAQAGCEGLQKISEAKGRRIKVKACVFRFR